VMVEPQTRVPPPPPEVKRPPPRPAPPPQIKVARAAPPPRAELQPPPPNDTPPPQQESKPVPLVVGLSMSSTTSSGSFSAPVGNTLYGKTADAAASPTDVKPYSAPKYTPLYQVDSPPAVTSEFKITYPEEARKAGIEGPVTLSILVDAEGRVVSAKLLTGPGYGLNEAALEAIKRFRFKPAIKGGQPVSTEMRYTYTFLLD